MKSNLINLDNLAKHSSKLQGLLNDYKRVLKAIELREDVDDLRDKAKRIKKRIDADVAEYEALPKEWLKKNSPFSVYNK
jgi:hypothetical protein